MVATAVTIAAAATVAAVQSTPAGRKATEAIAEGLSKAIANAQQSLTTVISQNPAGTSMVGQHAYLSKPAQATGGQAQQDQTSSGTPAQSRDGSTSPQNGGDNRHGGGKTGRKQNEDRAAKAEENYQRAKGDYDKLKSKPNKTKQENKQLEVLRKQRDHWQKKAKEISEEHAKTRQHS